MKEKQIGFIGVGNMATAILQGILRSQLYRPDEIAVFDPIEEKRKAFAEQGVLPVESGAQVVEQCRVVVLAVKPQSFEEVLAEIAPRMTPETVIVSIAAGISTQYIARKLGVACKTVRVMPNTPLLLGEGASALSKNENVTDEEFEVILNVFRACGKAAVVPKDKMKEIIAINGSSPAFIYLFAKGFVDYANSVGISADSALELFSQSLIGSAKMLTESGYTIDELIKMVSSPGGTTLAGLDKLYEGKLEDTVKNCCESCTKRAYELSK